MQTTQILESLLRIIVSCPPLHAQWLETLSHLELQGAKKIFKFLPTYFPDLNLLQHAYEESRHAYFFKRKVKTILKIKPKLLGNQFCHRYVHLVDLSVSKVLKKFFSNESELRQACYYLTSYLVEVRALQIYKSYNPLLNKLHLGWSLDALIKEESQHLTYMNQWILQQKHYNDTLPDLKRVEHKLYIRFLTALDISLKAFTDNEHLLNRAG